MSSGDEAPIVPRVRRKRNRVKNESDVKSEQFEVPSVYSMAIEAGDSIKQDLMFSSPVSSRRKVLSPQPNSCSPNISENEDNSKTLTKVTQARVKQEIVCVDVVQNRSGSVVPNSRIDDDTEELKQIKLRAKSSAKMHSTIGSMQDTLHALKGHICDYDERSDDLSSSQGDGSSRASDSRGIITLFVKYKSKQHTLSARSDETLEQIITKAGANLRFPAFPRAYKPPENVELFTAEEVKKPISDLALNFGDIIECIILGTGDTQFGHVPLVFQIVTTGKRFRRDFHSSTMLHDVFAKIADSAGLNERSLQFLLDGTPLDSTKTISEADLQAEDVIDVYS